MLYRLTLHADAADDLLQELFLRLRTAKGFGESRDRRAYAFRTAIHLAADWRRRRIRMRLQSGVDFEARSIESDPAGDLARQEEYAEVLDALSRIGQTARAAFVLRFIEERPFDEVAAALGKSQHQARALCQKATRRIREILRVRIERRDAREATT